MPDIGVVRRRDSDRIETIDAIYVDDRAGELQWALANTWPVRRRASYVPLAVAPPPNGSRGRPTAAGQGRAGPSPTSTCQDDP